MSRRVLALCALLLAALLVAGCGKAPPPASGPAATKPSHVELVSAGQSVLPAQVAACTSSHALEPPCTAIVPEGASGLIPSFVEGPLPVTLTGSAIRISDFGAELTASFENVPKAWYCPEPDPAYGWAIPTRGYGETGGIRRDSPCISKARALANLRYLMDTQYLGSTRALGVNLSPDQIAALGDLAWNCGPGVISGGLAELLRAHDWGAAAIYIRRYSYANGEFLPGLYSRRVHEGQLLQHPEPVHHETPAQRRAREQRELAGHEHELVLLRARIVVLRHVLLVDGCDARAERHESTGPRCKRWRAEGNADGAHGRLEDREIKRLKAALR